MTLLARYTHFSYLHLRRLLTFAISPVDSDSRANPAISYSRFDMIAGTLMLHWLLLICNRGFPCAWCYKRCAYAFIVILVFGIFFPRHFGNFFSMSTTSMLGPIYRASGFASTDAAPAGIVRAAVDRSTLVLLTKQAHQYLPSMFRHVFSNV